MRQLVRTLNGDNATEFIVYQRPTTQEDNHGGVIERWDIYPVGRHQVAGRLVQWTDGRFAANFAGVRFVWEKHELEFKNTDIL